MITFLDSAATLVAAIFIVSSLAVEGWDRWERALIIFSLMMTLTYLPLRTWGVL